MSLKKITFVLFTLNFLCLIYILSLAWYNRPALDDYGVLSVYHQFGIFNSVIKIYVHWQARLFPLLLNNIVFKTYELTGTLFHFTLFLYLGFVTALYRLLRQLLPAWKEEKWVLLNCAAFIFHAFMFFNFEFSTFYWVNVSTMYFGGVLAALFLVSEILSGKNIVLSWVIILIAGLYAATSAENFAIIFFILLAGVTAYFFTQRDKRFIKAGFALSVFAAAMVVMLLAPGTAARSSLFPVNSVYGTIITSLKSALTLIKVVVYQKWPYLIFLLVFSFLVGSFYPVLNRAGKRSLIKTILVFLFFLWLCLLPTSFIMGESGPLRAHTHIAFYIILFSGYVAFVVGNSTRLSGKLSAGVTIASGVIFSSLIGYKFVYELPAARTYAQLEDRKIELLLSEKQKGRHDMLVLPAQPLPNHFVLQPNTLKDTSFFANKCLGKALELNYPIKQE